MPPEKSKGKVKAADAKAAAAAELNENLAAFTLPESLPCSEVSFPVLIQRKNKANWKAILQESEHKMQEMEAYVESKVEPIPRSPFQRTECDYIKNEIFVYLLPALEETLNKAKLWNALQNQRCFFNGLDWIVQLLWNRNPLHPERKFDDLHLFNMPWVRQYLKEHPRPYYPKSWLWTEDYAATIIQKTVRQYFVQRDEEVQEMRDFWRHKNYSLYYRIDYKDRLQNSRSVALEDDFEKTKQGPSSIDIDTQNWFIRQIRYDHHHHIRPN